MVLLDLDSAIGDKGDIHMEEGKPWGILNMSLDFLGRSPWNTIFLVIIFLAIVALGWGHFRRTPG